MMLDQCEGIQRNTKNRFTLVARTSRHSLGESLSFVLREIEGSDGLRGADRFLSSDPDFPR